MGLKHGSMLTSSQTHKATAKCIESLSIKKWKHKTECDLVNISATCRFEGTMVKI